VTTPASDHSLARHYRRLLLAYPRWHRHLHGADLLTTLLDSAAAGRRGGPVREGLVLVLDGLRCRLRVRGIGPRILTAMVSMIFAATLAAMTGWFGWHATAAPWPTVEHAIALAGPVLPPGQPDTVTRRDDPFGPWLSDADSVLLTLIGSPELRPGGVYLDYVRPRVADRKTAYANAGNRLAAAGWHTKIDSGRLVAERGGLRITLLYANRDTGSDDVISVYPVPPPVSYRLTWAGAATGGVLGWLIAAAAFARGRRQRPSTRFATAALVTVGVAASTPACLLNVIAAAIADSDAGAAPPWVGYDFVFARPAAAIGALTLVGAWLLSTTGWKAGTPTTAKQPGTIDVPNGQVLP
jgi:hypothetical protein